MRKIYEFFKVLQFEKRIVAAPTTYVRKYAICILYSANALYDTQKMIQMAKLENSYLVNLIENLLEMSMPSKINPSFKMWLRNWKLLIATS